MNESVSTLKEIYKPYKQTIKKKSIILETSSGNYVVKPKNNINIKELYTYLESRHFNSFPSLIDDNRKEVNVFEYIEEINIPKEQKAMDMISVVGDLHNKTTYFKEVTEDNYKEIYDTISSNINYLKEMYSSLFTDIEKEVYMSPSHYLLIRNSSKILSALNFCEEELRNWYELVKDKNKQRVALIHNNLELDHFIKKEDGVLISWDHSKIDSPVLDLVKLYQSEALNVDFEEIFNKYNSRYPLNNEEKKLFFIIISLPKNITLTENEFNDCQNIRVSLDYLFKTEKLVKPYYTAEEIE